MKAKDNWFVRYMFYFFTLLLPNSIAVLTSFDFFKEWIKSLLDATGLLGMKDIVKVTFIIVIMIVLPFLVSKLESRFISNRIQKINRLLSIILASINSVVDYKHKRFSEHAKILKQGADAKSSFLSITQPVEQITKIHAAAVNCIQNFLEDDSIKLSIIECDNGLLKKYIIHSDDGPTLSCTQLQDNDSVARQTLINNKITIAEDIKNIAYKPTISNVRSILCYPSICDGRVKYIFSFTSKTDKAFVQKNMDQYDFIVKQFSKRFLLEMNLNQIKELVQS